MSMLFGIKERDELNAIIQEQKEEAEKLEEQIRQQNSELALHNNLNDIHTTLKKIYITLMEIRNDIRGVNVDENPEDEDTDG